MLEFVESQVLYHALEIVWEGSHKARNVEISVDSVGEGKVVSLRQDFDTMGEGSLPAHALLESGTGSSSAVDLSVE